MKGYTWATCSKVIQSEVRTLQTELQHLFGSNLLGIYLHGSLAQGGFQPRRSDINVIVVTGQEIGLESKRAALVLLLRLSKMPCPISICFLRRPDLLASPPSQSCDFHYNETRREIAQQDLRNDSWKDWGQHIWRDADLTTSLTVLHEAGICLCGRPITEIFPPVSTSAFLAGIVRKMYVAWDHLTRDPISFVLNACRVLAYIQDGMILSKDAGGTWGLARLPEQYHPLVEQSLALYRGEPLRRFVGRVLLEDFAELLMKKMAQALPLTDLETQKLRDEEAIIEKLCLTEGEFYPLPPKKGKDR